MRGGFDKVWRFEPDADFANGGVWRLEFSIGSIIREFVLVAREVGESLLNDADLLGAEDVLDNRLGLSVVDEGAIVGNEEVCEIGEVW